MRTQATLTVVPAIRPAFVPLEWLSSASFEGVARASVEVVGAGIVVPLEDVSLEDDGSV